MMFDVKVYAQFQPSSAFDVRAVVLAKRNTPVMTGSQNDQQGCAYEVRNYLPVDSARLPRRPM